MSLCYNCIHKDVCKNVTNVNESEGVVCPNRLVILFLCDKRADCKGPCYPDCHHTTDVRHAKNFERDEDQYSYLDSGYRVFKESVYLRLIPHETDSDWLDPEKDGFNVPYECKPPEDEDEESDIIPYVDDDWTALNERPFEGRPGTDA